MAGKTRRIDGIEILRSGSVILITAFHIYGGAQVNGRPGIFTAAAGGEVGTSIFLLITGFVIYWLGAHRPNMPSPFFLLSRLMRIYPTYWLALGVFLVVSFGGDWVRQGFIQLPDGGSLWVSLGLLPWPGRLYFISWVLTLDVAFYSVFALFFFRFGGRAMLTVMGLWSALTLGVWLAGVPSSRDGLLLLVNPKVLQLWAGCLLAAYLFKHPPRGYRWIGGFGLIGFFITLALDMPPSLGRELSDLVIASALVYGAAGYRGAVHGVLRELADSSYIMFLLHPVVMLAVSRLWIRAFGVSVYSSDASMLLLLFLCALAGVVVTRWVELPYRNWYRARLKRHFFPPAAAEG